jgi:bacterial/archaeal transporter family-2 protein
MFPSPLPGASQLSSMPWWAPLGGLVGAVQVYAGLTLVQKVGTGTFVGITVTAALATSMVLDNFGWFNVPVHPVSAWRVLGAALMASGVYLISKF